MEIQSFEDELQRKSMFALERVWEGYDNGRLDAMQAKASMHAVFDTISGITPSDIMEIIQDSVKALECELEEYYEILAEEEEKRTYSQRAVS